MDGVEAEDPAGLPQVLRVQLVDPLLLLLLIETSCGGVGGRRGRAGAGGAGTARSLESPGPGIREPGRGWRGDAGRRVATSRRPLFITPRHARSGGRRGPGGRGTGPTGRGTFPTCLRRESHRAVLEHPLGGGLLGHHRSHPAPSRRAGAPKLLLPPPGRVNGGRLLLGQRVGPGASPRCCRDYPYRYRRGLAPRHVCPRLSGGGRVEGSGLLPPARPGSGSRRQARRSRPPGGWGGARPDATVRPRPGSRQPREQRRGTGRHKSPAV